MPNPVIIGDATLYLGDSLDVLNGSGTTRIVATRHGRRYVGIDLNRDYLAISERRLSAAQRQQRMELSA